MSLDAFIPTHEPALRLTVFFGVLAAMAAWEVFAPRRTRMLSRRRRWPANLGIVVLNTALVRLLLPTAAVGVALSAASHGSGLLNHYILPSWAALAVPLELRRATD